MPQRLPSYEVCPPAVENKEESTSPRTDRQDEKSRWRLRGLLWRMQLGVLPCRSDSVDALRRASADGRRRYKDLRRRLLVDPHLMEEGQKPPDVGMDNPLSLDPDSIWGKYFRNAEIERIIDKDLSRLYPEYGDFFQDSGYQAMLQRILLVWSLIHPQLSYRQGMHELLAPLLYVLHVDLVQLSQIKKQYEDLFDDRFDEDAGRFKASNIKLPFGIGESDGDQKTNGHRESQGVFEHNELNVDLKVIVLGSDMYGAEGELGALFSARFMEHDAYCMFDALLSGQGGAVRMLDYFVTSGVPDASAALYRTLAAADISLYTHFVELGVEPQYFALRWLRLLFGREFVLEDLLLVWDAIFAASNEVIPQQEGDDSDINVSSRSALISAIAVSMLLHSRAALLAAPDATGCLQRLLNFPHMQDIRSFLENAKLLQPLAEAAARTPPPSVAKSSQHSRTTMSPQTAQKNASSAKGGGLKHQRSTSLSPELLKMFLPEGYWEEKWRTSLLQKSVVEDVARAPGTDSKGRVLSEGARASEVSKGRTAADKHDVDTKVTDSSTGVCTNSSNRPAPQKEPQKERGVGKIPVDSAVSDSETEVKPDSDVGNLKTEITKAASQKERGVEKVLEVKPDSDVGNLKTEITNGKRAASQKERGVEKVSEVKPDSDVGNLKAEITNGKKTASQNAVRDSKTQVTNENIVRAGAAQHNSAASNRVEDEVSTKVLDSNGTYENDGKEMGALDEVVIINDPLGVGSSRSTLHRSLNASPSDRSNRVNHSSVAADDCSNRVNHSSVAADDRSSRVNHSSVAADDRSNRVNHSSVRTDDRSNRVTHSSVAADDRSNQVNHSSAAADDRSNRVTHSSVGADDRSNRVDELVSLYPEVLPQELMASPSGPSKKVPVGAGRKPDDILDSARKYKAPVALQSLGQSMVEHIQVLESVLTQKVREGEQISKSFLGGKGHVSAMVALAELRKISNALLQM